MPRYTFKSLKPVDKFVPCHGATPDLPYHESDEAWEFEMLQQVAFFMQPAKNTRAKVMTREQIDERWQVDAVDYIQDACKNAKPGDAPIRTRHLFLEIQTRMTKLLTKLVEIGVLAYKE